MMLWITDKQRPQGIKIIVGLNADLDPSAAELSARLFILELQIWSRLFCWSRELYFRVEFFFFWSWKFCLLSRKFLLQSIIFLRAEKFSYSTIEFFFESGIIFSSREFFLEYRITLSSQEFFPQVENFF